MAKDRLCGASRFNAFRSDRQLAHDGVGPLVAPGSGHAVVDVGLSAIIEDGPHAPGEIAAQVARARARTLVDGTGTP